MIEEVEDREGEKEREEVEDKERERERDRVRERERRDGLVKGQEEKKLKKETHGRWEHGLHNKRSPKSKGLSYILGRAPDP